MTQAYTTIPIDFDVFQGLTAGLKSPAEDYNEVIRRLLGLPDTNSALLPGEIDSPGLPVKTNALSQQPDGIWFSDVYFPDGTLFRATYKGKTYYGRVKDSQWIDDLGLVMNSPSHAAFMVTQNNVNGWRFWYVRRPADLDWQRMDALKR